MDNKPNLPEEDYIDEIDLVITHRCMLSCSYCFVKKEGIDVDPRVLAKSLELISKINKRIMVVFFGGEPLIRFDLIKSAILTLKELDKNINKYNFYIFTNGVLLSKIDLYFLKKFNIGLLISIDGDRKTHNLYRGNTHFDSYGTILKTMPKIKSLGINCKAYHTLTPASTKNLYKNFLHLKKIGFDAIEICPVFNLFNREKLWNTNIFKTLENQMSKIADDYYLDYLKTNGQPKTELGISMIYQKYVKNNLDIIELDQLGIGIDVDGNMYVGLEFLALDKKSREKIKIGNVFEVSSLDKYYKKYIYNRERFRKQLLRNPAIVDYYKDPCLKVMKVIYKVMGNLNKKMQKLQKNKNE